MRWRISILGRIYTSRLGELGKNYTRIDTDRNGGANAYQKDIGASSS